MLLTSPTKAASLTPAPIVPAAKAFILSASDNLSIVGPYLIILAALFPSAATLEASVNPLLAKLK